ncbi:MAG: hypothetical protein AAGI90_01165 [Chlamydiota bacterium]
MHVPVPTVQYANYIKQLQTRGLFLGSISEEVEKLANVRDSWCNQIQKINKFIFDQIVSSLEKLPKIMKAAKNNQPIVKIDECNLALVRAAFMQRIPLYIQKKDRKARTLSPKDLVPFQFDLCFEKCAENARKELYAEMIRLGAKFSKRGSELPFIDLFNKLFHKSSKAKNSPLQIANAPNTKEQDAQNRALIKPSDDGVIVEKTDEVTEFQGDQNRVKQTAYQRMRVQKTLTTVFQWVFGGKKAGPQYRGNFADLPTNAEYKDHKCEHKVPSFAGADETKKTALSSPIKTSKGNNGFMIVDLKPVIALD